MGIERLFIRDDWFAHAHAAFAIQPLSGKGRLGLHDFKQAAKHYLAALSQFFAEQAIEGPFAITLSIQGLAEGEHSGAGFRIPASSARSDRIARDVEDGELVADFLRLCGKRPCSADRSNDWVELRGWHPNGGCASLYSNHDGGTYLCA